MQNATITLYEATPIKRKKNIDPTSLLDLRVDLIWEVCGELRSEIKILETHEHFRCGDGWEVVVRGEGVNCLTGLEPESLPSGGRM